MRSSGGAESSSASCKASAPSPPLSSSLRILFSELLPIAPWETVLPKVGPLRLPNLPSVRLADVPALASAAEREELQAGRPMWITSSNKGVQW